MASHSPPLVRMTPPSPPPPALDNKSDRIKALFGTGLSDAEIAEQVGCEIAYVRTVRSKQKAKRERKIETGESTSVAPAEEVLGSDMAALRNIIRESSSTKKVDAIIRAFSNMMPDNFVGLAKLCNRARIPIADTAFIIENYGQHRGAILTADEINEIINESRVSAYRSFKKTESSQPPASIEELEEQQAAALHKETTLLRQRQMIKDMRSDLSSPNASNQQMVKRVTKKVRYDAEGNMVTGADGNPVFDVIEEELPSNAPMLQQQGGGSDYLPILLQQMNQQTSNSNQMFTSLMTAFIEAQKQTAPPSDGGNNEMLIKLMELQRDKEVEALKNTQTNQITELKTLITQKDMQDQYGGMMHELQEEIKSLHSQGTSDERFRLQMQTDLTKKLIDEVSGAKDTVGGALGTMAKEMAEDRRHLRHLEQMRAARDMGLDPSDFKSSWESERVPSVSDDDFTAIMAGG